MFPYSYFFRSHRPWPDTKLAYQCELRPQMDAHLTNSFLIERGRWLCQTNSSLSSSCWQRSIPRIASSFDSATLAFTLLSISTCPYSGDCEQAYTFSSTTYWKYSWEFPICRAREADISNLYTKLRKFSLEHCPKQLTVVTAIQIMTNTHRMQANIVNP